MKRRILLVPPALLSLGLLGCAPGDDAALTVNGDEVLTIGQVEDRLEEMRDAEDFLTAYGARGAGSETLSSSIVTTVLNFHVLTSLVEAEVAARGGAVTEANRSDADEFVTAGLEAGDPQSGATPIQIDEVPDAYFGALVDLYSGFYALGDTYDDREAASIRVGELLEAADVEVAARYGRWDPAQAEVVAPEGPLTPSTTLPTATPAG